MALPQPLAAHAQVGFDPVTRSLLVKPAASSEAYARSLWRRGHAALTAAAESGRYWNTPDVWARAPGRPDLARGQAVPDGWLRFKLSDADYRQLAGDGPPTAIVTVDRRSQKILGVTFRHKS